MIPPLMRFLLFLLLAGCAGPQSPAAVAPADPLLERYPELNDDMPWDPAVRKGQLDNGLSWYVEENREPKERVELWLAVRVGSVHEDDDQQGLAHYVEHMAFNGTKSFPKNELIEYLESIGTQFGAHLNAHTSFEETVYKLQVPTDDAALIADGFRVLRDWADGMSFESEEMEKERGVVLEEWRRSRGAGGRARDAQVPLTYHGARHAERLPIGTKDSLETFDLDSARRFYSDWYRPDLMAVFVVGDIDGAAMQAQIEGTFGDMKGPEVPRERTQYPIPTHAETLYGAHADPEQSYSIVRVLRKIPEVEGGDVRDYRRIYVQRTALQVLNERLRALTKRADAPFLQAGAFRGRMSPVAVQESGYAVVKDGHAEAGLEALLIEAERLRRYGATKGEMDRAKSILLSGLKQAFDQRATSPSRNVLQELLRNFTNGETVPGLDYEWTAGQKYIPEIGLEEVNAFAAGFLVSDSRVVLTIVPQKEGVEPPSEDALEAVVAGIAAQTIDAPTNEEITGPLLSELPTPGTIVSESFDEATQTHEWTLSNGLLVLLKPTDFKADEIRFHGYTMGGHSQVSDEDVVAATTAIGITNISGYGPYNAEQLEKWFAGKVADVPVYIGETRQGTRGATRPADLEHAMQIIYARLTQPRFDEGGFQVAAQYQLEWLRNRDSQPITPFADAFTRLLWDDHVRTRPWTVESIQGMDLAKSEAFYRQRLGHWGDGVFAWVGAFDLEAMRPLIEQYLATLPAGEPETYVDIGKVPAQGKHEETVLRGLEAKAQVRIRYSGEFESTPDNRHQLRMLGKWLSMRLREVLREDLGGTYSTGARINDRFHPTQDYGIQIDFQCDPLRTEELTKAAYAVIDEALAGPPDASYAQRIAEQERRSLETNLRSNRFWLGALTGNRQRNEPREALDHYWSLHSSITSEYLHAAAKRYIDTDRVVQVTLLPEAATDPEAPTESAP
jgi:zinc protease